MKMPNAVAQFFAASLFALSAVTLAFPAAADDAEDAAIEAERLATELTYFLTTGRCVKCNLSKADMSGRDLSGARLTSANLEGSNLSGADLRRAELGNTKMEGANLKGADLSDANLSGANFREVDLTGANLSAANLEGADFWGAEIRRADLTKLKVENTLGMTKEEVGSSGKISIFDR